MGGNWSSVSVRCLSSYTMITSLSLHSSVPGSPMTVTTSAHSHRSKEEDSEGAVTKQR